jgi:hypothetical protein
MPRYRTAYPPEFRRQMVDLVQTERWRDFISHLQVLIGVWARVKFRK